MRDEHDSLTEAYDKLLRDVERLEAAAQAEARAIRRPRPLRLRRRFERWQYAIVGAGALIAFVVVVVAR